MTWTYSGNTALTVSIVARVATITIPNLDWYGAETITFKATDPGSLWDDDAAVFTVTGEINITTLSVGWNFVSLPFNKTITKTNIFVMYSATRYNWSDAVSAGIVIDTIWGWNRTYQTYGLPVNILQPGYGYWIFSWHVCEIWAVINTPIVTTNYITPLLHDWNVIGVPVNQLVNKTSLIVNYGGIDYNWTRATTNQNPTNSPIIDHNIFGWKRNTPQGYILSDVLDAGYCYWIYAYTPCILKRTT
jgi:hypothetical protein